MIKALLVLEVVSLCFVCSGISATILLAFSKWGILDLYSVYKDKIWTRLPASLCIFCLGFWLCFAQAIILYFWFNSNIFYIAIPLAGGAITKVLYAGSLNRPG